jgi:hypothetical protein
MECCKNDIGKFPHNEAINTGIVVPVYGTYEIELSAMNFTTFKLKQKYGAGDTIIIPQGTLCEDFLYNFTVKKPDGTFLQVNSCENFILKTYISTNNLCDDYVCNY